MKTTYTVITGNYDKLRDPINYDRNWRYVCFTDNSALKSDVYEVRPLPNPDHLAPALLSRKPKLLPHRYLPDADITIYHDANMQWKVSPQQALNMHHGSITAIEHPWRNCVYQEAQELAKLGYDPNALHHFLNFIRGGGFPKKNGLYACGLLIRTDNTIIRLLNGIWWSYTQYFLPRDQLYLPYLHYLSGDGGIKLNTIPWDTVMNEFFIYHKHGQ